MDTLKRLPRKHMVIAFLAVMLALGLAPAGAFAASAADGGSASGLVAGKALTGQAAAKPVKVFVTVSNAGTLALAHQQVKVSDVNEDGKVTVNEVLKATHEAHCKDGYATAKVSGSRTVTKLWGESGTGFMFYRNDKMTANIFKEEVAANDSLVAVVQKDKEHHSDHYAYFGRDQVNVAVNNSFDLRLFSLGAAQTGKAQAVEDVQIGVWDDGTFKPLKGKTTNGRGMVTLSFNATGTYIVSAQGTVSDNVTINSKTDKTKKMDCPLSAPFCIVKVNKAVNTMRVSSDQKNISLKEVKEKSVTVAPLTVKDAEGAKTFSVEKWTTVKAKRYFTVNEKTGKVTAKKGTPKGTYNFKVKVTAKGNKKFMGKSTTKFVRIVVD